jgi:hypothetical protein
MNGKIKLRIGSKSSFWNRRYKVYLNGNIVGNIDYKNPQIAFDANIGNNLLMVQNKTFEKELNLQITTEKTIFPIELKENWNSNTSESQTYKLLLGLKIGFLIAYALIFAYLTIIENKKITSSLIIPSIILISLGLSNKKTEPFDLNFKKF